jgi:hypothetical protein
MTYLHFEASQQVGPDLKRKEKDKTLRKKPIQFYDII